MYYIPGVKKLPDFYVNRAEKSHKKFLKKSLKKVLTLRNQSSIINKLSLERHDYETENAMVFVCSSSEQTKRTLTTE